MKLFDITPPLFNILDKDFKAEVLAAEMVESGVDADRILILLLGAMRRPFSKDVDTVEEELSDYDHKEYLVVKTPREGIYDMLPEGLFHHPNVYKSATSEKEIIKAMKIRREEEKNARKFFLPFEATINFLRMQMVLYEDRLDKRSHYDELVQIFASQWEIFQYLDARQANIFLHLIPILHDVRDDHPVIETIMEMMLELPVHIRLRWQLPLLPAEPMMSKLGECHLGIDLTTGNDFFNEGVEELVVKIGPMKSKVLQQYMPGGRNSHILRLLSDYLLPVHMDIITQFELEQNDKVFRLADQITTVNSTLGADTYL